MSKNAEFWRPDIVPLSALSPGRLSRLRVHLDTRLGGMESFVPWPRLIESIRATIADIDAEIARRAKTA